MSDPGSRSQSLFKASAEGVKFLVLLQLSSRLLTFVVNQILLRYLSPELLGISVQFELFVLSILYFSRESLRTAVQRYGITTSNTQPRRTSPGDKLLEGTAAAQSQTVVNLSYATIPLGGLFAAILYKSISSVASTQPNFKMSVILYIIATILELLTEPAFAITQQKLLYKIRAGAETAAAFTRCFLTCAITIYYAKTSNTSAGPLPFAIGQFGYAVVLQAIYYLKVYGVAKDGGFSLGLWRLASS